MHIDQQNVQNDESHPRINKFDSNYATYCLINNAVHEKKHTHTIQMHKLGLRKHHEWIEFNEFNISYWIFFYVVKRDRSDTESSILVVWIYLPVNENRVCFHV